MVNILAIAASILAISSLVTAGPVAAIEERQMDMADRVMCGDEAVWEQRGPTKALKSCIKKLKARGNDICHIPKDGFPRFCVEGGISVVGNVLFSDMSVDAKCSHVALLAERVLNKCQKSGTVQGDAFFGREVYGTYISVYGTPPGEPDV